MHVENPNMLNMPMIWLVKGVPQTQDIYLDGEYSEY